MFTGFATENTPAIQVWDFARTVGSGSVRLALTDDCAPIQFFRTGAVSTIFLYLPSCPIEGKRITIYNTRYNTTSTTSIQIYSSDVSGTGTNNLIDSVGVGGVVELCYSRNNIFGPTLGVSNTGWTTLNKSSYASANAQSINSSYAGHATGQYSAAIGGFGNVSLGVYSGCFGGANSQANSANAVTVGGSANIANGTSSITSGGEYGTSRAINGNVVFAASNSPISGSAGISQTGLLILGRQTTDATATVLRSTTAAASTANQLILPNNSAYVFQGTVIANVTGGGDTSGWRFEGTIKRGANAASTTLVAAVTPTVISQDAGASAWVVAVTADTTNGGLAVTVTGAAATTIRWVCRLESTEVTF